MEATAASAQTTRDEFLHLLVTQLRHQDPLEPIKQEDFLSQLAQFSTLEGIETLNASFERQLAVQQDLVQMQQFTQSSNLIGKQVTFESPSSDDNREGIIEGVVVTHDGLRLRVADELIAVDQIKSLSEASLQNSAPPAPETVAPPMPTSQEPETTTVPIPSDETTVENEPAFFPRILFNKALASDSLR